jgi:hypothetical protein
MLCSDSDAKDVVVECCSDIFEGGEGRVLRLWEC